MKKGLIIGSVVAGTIIVAGTVIVIKSKKLFKENLQIDLITARKYICNISDEILAENFDKIKEIDHDITDMLDNLDKKEWYTMTKLQEAANITQCIVMRAVEIKKIDEARKK